MAVISTIRMDGSDKPLIGVSGGPTPELKLVGYAEARKPVGQPAGTLSVESQVGDLAVLAFAGQQTMELVGQNIPNFWSGVFDSPTHIGSSRSGYLVWRRITDPNQTQNVPWFFDRPHWGARQNAVLLVFRNAADLTPADIFYWDGEPAPADGDVYYISQSHGPAQNAPMPWGADEIVIDGSSFASTTESWSTMRVGRSSTKPVLVTGQAVAAWCGVRVRPSTTATPKVEVTDVSSAAFMPYGCRTIGTLFGKDDFTIAHRGGSQSWSEHTMAAYSNALACGVDAFEVSVARTADGVWIACHDENLERIGGPKAAVSTLRYQEIVDAMGHTENMPVRLDALLEIYGGKVAMAIDPKYEAARTAELRAILDPFKASIAIKYFGDAEWLFRSWHNNGYKTIAYVYAASQTAEWYSAMKSSSNIDAIMAEYHAPKTQWDDLKTTGKVLISHIAPDLEAMAQGKTLGAKGCMLAAPKLLGYKV